MEPYRRILIIKPSSLGDIIQALPTLAALRNTYPGAHIAWLVKRQWAALLERAEGIDQIWPVDPGLAGWLSLVSSLRRARYDLIADLQGLFRSAAMARLTGCRTRIGFANGREGSPVFYTRRVPVLTADMHAVDRYLLIAMAAGAKVDRVEFRLRIDQSDQRQVVRLLSQHGMNGSDPWIAMNVSARWPTKRWPAECFAEVADRLRQEKIGQAALIGGPDDRDAALAVKTHMKSTPIDLTGKTSLGLLPALLRSTALLVTNDSGPLHLAAAVGTPVVALFGPTNPIRTGPYGGGHRVLRSGIPCSPCFSRVCRNLIHLECLKTISPDHVFEAAREQLAARMIRCDV
jgi:heptosyltransferase-1